MADTTDNKWRKSGILTNHFSPNDPEAQNFHDDECHQMGRKQAMVQAWKNTYLAQIRKDPSSVMGPKFATKMLMLEGDNLEEQAHKTATVVYLVTFNPIARSGDEDKISAYALSFANHLRKYKWILAFDLCVEISNPNPPKDKKVANPGRPHIHAVIHIKEQRWRSEVKAQIWSMAHNQYHTKTYEQFLVGEGHNADHLDVRPCPTRDDINRARKYILKGWESENPKYFNTGISRQSKGLKLSKLLFPDTYVEKEIVEEN